MVEINPMSDTVTSLDKFIQPLVKNLVVKFACYVSSIVCEDSCAVSLQLCDV